MRWAAEVGAKSSFQSWVFRELSFFMIMFPLKEAAMSLYAAIDLHSSNSVLAVMGGDGKALLQC